MSTEGHLRARAHIFQLKGVGESHDSHPLAIITGTRFGTDAREAIDGRQVTNIRQYTLFSSAIEREK